MATQYDIDYNQQVIELLPPDKRYTNMVTFLSDCMISTLQYLRDAVLGDYQNGSTVSAWVDPATSGTPYARGVKVNYKNAIFVSLVNDNTDIPTNTVTWYMQQQFFIGLNERLAYNGQNLVLTYALNRWFGTTFRQPGEGLSDIYITTNPINQTAFIVGDSDIDSSTIGYGSSSGYIDGILPGQPQYNCNIYVPAAVYNALGAANTANALISSYVNQYIIAGCTYQILTY